MKVQTYIRNKASYRYTSTKPPAAAAQSTADPTTMTEAVTVIRYIKITLLARQHTSHP
jgi:hypothetical protein